MSESVTTIEIAAELKAQLGTVLGTIGYSVPVRVEPDRTRTATTDDAPVRPLVGVRVGEFYAVDGQQSYRLRECNVEIQAQTDYADDPGQAQLAEISQAVGRWVLGAPTLNLTSGTFRRFSLPEPPTRDESINRVQFTSWNVVVGVFFTS